MHYQTCLLPNRVPFKHFTFQEAGKVTQLASLALQQSAEWVGCYHQNKHVSLRHQENPFKSTTSI